LPPRVREKKIWNPGKGKRKSGPPYRDSGFVRAERSAAYLRSPELCEGIIQETRKGEIGKKGRGTAAILKKEETSCAAQAVCPLLLTPGFSPVRVLAGQKAVSTAYLGPSGKPLKRLCIWLCSHTGLKPGVNENFLISWFPGFLIVFS